MMDMPSTASDADAHVFLFLYSTLCGYAASLSAMACIVSAAYGVLVLCNG